MKNRKSNSADIMKINSMKLIQLVRNYEALYNSDAEGYTDKNQKEIIWERIHMSLFPKFETLSEDLKEMIRLNVRRRWKTLRNAIAREVRKNATVENYCRKKESPIIAELEFLIPHIKSSYCAKLADELGLRESYYRITDPEDHDDPDDDFNDLIDLTEELDTKPYIKSEQSYVYEDSSSDAMPNTVLYPAIQMSTSESTQNETNRLVATVMPSNNTSQSSEWSSEFCSLAQYKEGEFTNATVVCTSKESDETAAVLSLLDSRNSEESDDNPPPMSPSKKRPRTDNEDSTELQAKILQLLTNLERRERVEARADQDAHDEDRMFLLSLVSDLKRIPPAKKMLVKAEIITTIVRGIQQ